MSEYVYLSRTPTTGSLAVHRDVLLALLDRAEQDNISAPKESIASPPAPEDEPC
jgi:hypothetical protein